MQSITPALTGERIQSSCRRLGVVAEQNPDIEPRGNSDPARTVTKTLDAAAAKNGVEMEKSFVSERHEHVDTNGSIYECWHECKSEIKRPAFWILNLFLTFLLFPFEHALYTHVVPFVWISKLLGLD